MLWWTALESQKIDGKSWWSRKIVRRSFQLNEISDSQNFEDDIDSDEEEDFNTQNMINPTIVYPVKMKYGWNSINFGLKMMMKSGLEIIFRLV